MSRQNPVPATALPFDPFAAVRELPAVRSLHGAPLHFVMSLRFCALCRAARRDPLADLAIHFGNVEAAGAVVALADGVARMWPDSFEVCRPCCPRLTADESTLAQMAHYALAGNRGAFSALLDGFVRARRHDALYDLSTNTVVALQGVMPNH
ncbi:MAG: hypothetical protein KDE63_08910 [Novosphingobium sp.]|nr:hypothetical protein [Novosphingobium sp.]